MSELISNSLQVRIRKQLSSAKRGTFMLDVEFIAQPGITILFGPSGSGKTTILQCVAGLLRPDAGRIQIAGNILDDCEQAKHIAVNRRNVGYVFQNLALFPHMTVEENIHYGMAGLSSEERARRTAAVLQSFHIPHLLHRHPSEISGGERQRVALARTLVMEPQALLLDEPMSALDGATKAKIMEDLRAWNAQRRIPVLYVTHGRREVFALGEHVVALEHGRIIAQGPPQSVLEAPRHELLAQLAGFENIFETTVIAQHEDHGTMTCRIDRRVQPMSGGNEVIEQKQDGTLVLLEAPLVRLGEGTTVRLAVRAGDILLSREVPRALSARNVFEGRLISMRREGVLVIAEVACHGTKFTVDLTPSAVESLGLAIGMQVWLVIKTYSCHLLERRESDLTVGTDRPAGSSGSDDLKHTKSSKRFFPDHASNGRSGSWRARLKVLYLLLITASAFAVPAVPATRGLAWYLVPALLGLQILILLASEIEPADIARTGLRLKWLFLFLLATYTLLPGDPTKDLIFYWQPFANLRSLALDITGLRTAGLMCLQILTVILVSAVVRLTGSGTDLIEGLRGFGFPPLFVYSADYTLALLGGLRRRGMGGGSGMGSGGGKNRHRDEADVSPHDRPGLREVLRRVTSGDVAVFTDAVQQNMARAQEHVVRESQGKLDSRMAHDVAVITGISLMMMSMKMLKILPGLPFFSGFKTILLYPLYILAADMTYSRWGGTVCGTIMGVLGFLQGDGRYGAMEILKHTAPGFVIDLSWPLVRRLRRSILLYCVLGFIVAIARTSTEFATILLLRPRDEVFLFPFAKLIPNLIAGTMSGFMTFFILPAFRGAEAANKAAPGEASGTEQPAAEAPKEPTAATVAAPASEAERRPGSGGGGGRGSGGSRGMGGGRGAGRQGD